MNGEFCTRPPQNTSFFINAVLHIVILLTIVSSFFFFYVSKLSQDKFKHELKNIINENLGETLRTSDKTGTLKEGLKNIDLTRVIAYYKDKEDEVMKVQNQWLFRVTVICILALFVTVILSIAILRQSCNQCAPMSHILKENIILFAFIGIVEVTFFMKVASKYVPTKPSLMMQSIVDSLKANFPV